MGKKYEATGTLSGGRVVTLDEAVPIGDARVRVSIEPVTGEPARSVVDVIADIRRSQAERGHVPPTRDEVDAYLAEERAGWNA